MSAFFSMLGITCRFTFLQLVIYLLTGLFTGVALAMLHTFSLWHMPPWLAPLALSQPVVLAVGLGAVVCAACSGQAYCLWVLKGRDGLNWKARLPPLNPGADEWLYGLVPRVFAVAVITSSLWVLPWLQTSPDWALLSFAVGIAGAWLWALAAVVLSRRQALRGQRYGNRFRA
jgi:hypothetical protein